MPTSAGARATRVDRGGSFGGWLVRYLAILLIGVLALSYVDTGALCELLARATRGILALAGSEIRREGAFLRGDAFSMQVVSACDGTDVCLLLGAAILATTTSWRRRLTGLAVALVLTEVVNVGRLVALFMVGASFPEHFEAAHQIFWQAAMMVWALIFFVRWL